MDPARVRGLSGAQAVPTSRLADVFCRTARSQGQGSYVKRKKQTGQNFALTLDINGP